jgi:protein-tyrosine phosphatase
MHGTDWFQRLTGFAEGRHGQTQVRLKVEGGRLVCPNGRSYGTGRFEQLSLAQLRERVAAGGALAGSLRVSLVTGDAGVLHRDPANAGALFQVASQFNVLEMVGPQVTPEDGVTRYQDEHTQGPACAIAAGAATIYRNYFVPVGDQMGQTAARQIDCLAGLGAALSRATGRPVSALWEMKNGYALCTAAGLAAINTHLSGLDESQRDALRSELAIGLTWDAEVTGGEWPGQSVSQAFCSALPVAYGAHDVEAWGPFAQLVLEASYEAALWAALLNARRGASPTVLLTLVGGGAFGNRGEWIEAALDRALALAARCDLDVRLVSYSGTRPEFTRVKRRAEQRARERAPAKTSFTDPLRIAELPVGGQGGVLGVTFAPGKVDEHSPRGPWMRSLEVDLAAIRRWGATDLVTLVEQHELRRLQMLALPQRAAAHGLTWHHLPIVDVDIPQRRFLKAWPALSAALVGRLGQGGRVVVHCRGGIGRAGTVAAMLLMDSGAAADAAEAIRRVRAARDRRCIEWCQEEFLHTYRPAA